MITCTSIYSIHLLLTRGTGSTNHLPPCYLPFWMIITEFVKYKRLWTHCTFPLTLNWHAKILIISSVTGPSFFQHTHSQLHVSGCAEAHGKNYHSLTISQKNHHLNLCDHKVNITTKRSTKLLWILMTCLHGVHQWLLWNSRNLFQRTTHWMCVYYHRNRHVTKDQFNEPKGHDDPTAHCFKISYVKAYFCSFQNEKRKIDTSPPNFHWEL